MHGSHPPGEGLGLVANRSSTLVHRLSQYPQQQQQVHMAGRPPSTNPHYNPQQFAAAASSSASTMMMAQQQQRPVGQMQQQQQQRPAGVALQGSQIRGGAYLQQSQQFPQNQYVHHMGSIPMNSANQVRPGVQGGIAPATGTPHYGNMQSLGVAQQHNMQARQKPNQGQTVPSHYIGNMQQQNLGAVRPGVTLTAQQQHQQQQQAIQQQQLNAQQRLGPQQQQAMARQTPSPQMLQNQGLLSRGTSTGAQMQGISPGASQQPMYSLGKPAQYQQQQQQHQQPQQRQQQQQPQQQQPQQQQQARPQMAANQARPGTPVASAAQTLPAPANSEPLDATGSILGKRSIRDLLAQIDPHERLDPDVEEVLLELADDFIESVTSFGVKLAKHRKSDVLEAKDVLLHLDKEWNITVPGFGGDEYRSFKRPSVSETHKQRLSVVRKSAAAGQAAMESKALSAAAAQGTNVVTPVKSGLTGLSTGSPSGGSPGMARLPRL